LAFGTFNYSKNYFHSELTSFQGLEVKAVPKSNHH